MKKKLMIMALICIANISYGSNSGTTATTSGTNVTYMKVESEYNDVTSNEKVWVKSVGFWSDKTTAKLKDTGVTDQVKNLQIGIAQLQGLSFAKLSFDNKIKQMNDLFKKITDTLGILKQISQTQVGKDGSGIVDQKENEVNNLQKNLADLKKATIAAEQKRIKDELAIKIVELQKNLDNLNDLTPDKVQNQGEELKKQANDLLTEISNDKTQLGDNGGSDLDSCGIRIKGILTSITEAQTRAKDALKNQEISKEVKDNNITDQLKVLLSQAGDLKDHSYNGLNQDADDLKKKLDPLLEKLNEIKNNHGDNSELIGLREDINNIEDKIDESVKNVEAKKVLTDEQGKVKDRNNRIKDLVEKINQGQGLNSSEKNKLKDDIDNSTDNLDNSNPIKNNSIDKDKDNLKDDLGDLKDMLSKLSQLNDLKAASTGNSNHDKSLDDFNKDLQSVKNKVNNLPDGDLKDKLNETINKIDKDRAENDKNKIDSGIGDIENKLKNPDLSQLGGITDSIKNLKDLVNKTLVRLRKNPSNNVELINEYSGLLIRLNKFSRNNALRDLKNQKRTNDREKYRQEIKDKLDGLLNNLHHHSSPNQIQNMINRATRQANNQSQAEKDVVKALQDKLNDYKRGQNRSGIDNDLKKVTLDKIDSWSAYNGLQQNINELQQRINDAKNNSNNHPEDLAKVKVLQDKLKNIINSDAYKNAPEKLHAKDRETDRQNISNTIRILPNLSKINTQSGLNNLNDQIKNIETRINTAKNAAKNHTNEASKIADLEQKLSDIKSSNAYKNIAKQIVDKDAAVQKARDDAAAVTKARQHTQDLATKAALETQSQKSTNDLARYNNQNIKSLLDGLNGATKNTTNQNEINSIQTELQKKIDDLNRKINSIDALKGRLGNDGNNLSQVKKSLEDLRDSLKDLKTQADQTKSNLVAPIPVQQQGSAHVAKSTGTTAGPDKETSVEIISGSDSHGELTGSGGF